MTKITAERACEILGANFDTETAMQEHGAAAASYLGRLAILAMVARKVYSDLDAAGKVAEAMRHFDVFAKAEDAFFAALEERA